MFNTKRSILAIIYCTLLFGIALTPYYYVVLGILSKLPLRLAFFALVTLLASTAVLFLGLVPTSKSKIALFQFAPKLPLPLRIAVLFLAFLCSCLLVLNMAFADLGEDIQKLFYMLKTVGLVSAVTLIPVLFFPPSNLEQFLSLKFNQSTKAHLAYRIAANLILILALVSVGYLVYQFRQFESQSAGG